MAVKRNEKLSRKIKSEVRHLKRNTLHDKPLGMLVSGILLLVVVLITVSYFIYRISIGRYEKLSQDVVNLRSAMNIDSVRQYQIQKAMKIIEQHNKGLSPTEAYEIANEIYEMSQKYTNLNIDLLCAMITHESAGTWNPRVVSKANAMGLMQVMPVTGFFLASYEGISWTSAEEVLFNPIYNLRIGSRLLSTLIGRYGLEGGLAAYNGGEKWAAIWLANGKDNKYLMNETRDYVPAVLKLYALYRAQRL